MALDSINIGNIPNDGTGDDLRTAFEKINNNFISLNAAQGSSVSSSTAPNSLVLRDPNGNINSNKSYYKNIFSNLSDLPPAGNYPGMFVYVDGVGAYFSNGNTWKRLSNYNPAGAVTDGILRWNGSEFAATDTGVKTINNLSGDVVLTSNDIITILGFVPMGANSGALPGDIVTFTGNGAIKLPAGLTAQRPGVTTGTAVPGMMRYNNQLDCIEAYIGPSGSVAWQTIGPLGSAPANFTSATITNALSAGTIAATSIAVSTSLNGPLGATTPAAATVTALASSGAVTITATTPNTGSGTGALVVSGGASIGGNLYVGGTITLNSATEASSTSVAAWVVPGGTGIGKKLYVGGVTTLNNTDQSNSTGTGALVVAGGAGIAKNAYVGGILSVTGAAVLASTLTVADDVTLSKLSASSLVFTDSIKKLTTTGSITVPQGGTGLSSYTVGDMIYANGTTALAAIAGNTTTTKKFLTQTGTGTASAGPLWNTIVETDLSTALFKDYTPGVASPTAALTASNSIHGFNAYTSTDFPGDFYVGWTVKSTTVGAQLAINWNVEEVGSATKVYVRANDDTGTTTAWSSWERVITSTAADANLSINNLTSAGYIQPSTGSSATNGIVFPANPGGGAGDVAKIQYYAVTGEQTELLLSVSNDTNDSIRMTASGAVYVDTTLDTVQRRESFNNYSTAISGGTVLFDCAASGDIIYISGSVSGAWVANLINLRLDVGKMKTIRFIISQAASPYVPTLQIASTATSISWAGGSTPTGNATKKDLINLNILCTATNTYTVLGQLTAFG